MGWLYLMILIGRLFIIVFTLFLILKSSGCINKSCSVKTICHRNDWIYIRVLYIISAMDAGMIANCVWLLFAPLFMICVLERTENTTSEEIMTVVKA